MGINIHAGETIRDASSVTHELIREANGFAQVLPRDKREVVLVLKDQFKRVVGMTGDGVNDAPALSAAQCGIAVDDATDAAKNAAAIILTSPGLSAIYSAVVESRKIFRKLKSYVIYRFGATTQIVFVLTLLIYYSNCTIDSLYVVLLALFNDVTMIPIAYDVQQASAKPENPNVGKLLVISSGLGIMQTVASLLFAYGLGPSGVGDSSTYIVEPNCETSIQAAIWLQMFISAELLIFCARAPSYIFTSIAPSAALFVSVIAGCLTVSVMAYLSDTFGALSIHDIVLVWLYDIACLIVIDVIKVEILKFFNEDMDVLPELETEDDGELNMLASEEEEEERLSLARQSKVAGREAVDMLVSKLGTTKEGDFSRSAAQSLRLENWHEKQVSLSKSARFSNLTSNSAANTSLVRGSASVAQQELSIRSRNVVRALAEASQAAQSQQPNASSSLRQTIVNRGNLRPLTPSSNLRKVRIPF